MRAYTETELQQVLGRLPEWHLEDGALVRTWSFAGFPEAIAFVQRVAGQAERMDHHPDIDIRYNRVRLALVTHDSGGITPRDSEFAAEIDKD